MFVRESASRFLQRCAYASCVAVLGFSFAFVGISSSHESSRKVIARTTPTYPELAKKMHLNGKVKVEVTINAAGAVTSAKLIGGNPVFETSSVDAVKQWKFEPS